MEYSTTCAAASIPLSMLLLLAGHSQALTFSLHNLSRVHVCSLEVYIRSKSSMQYHSYLVLHLLEPAAAPLLSHLHRHCLSDHLPSYLTPRQAVYTRMVC